MSETESEARRILGNMCRMPSYHGTTTADVVDEVCKGSLSVFCNGYLRKVVFEQITKNSFSFRTVAFK
jgi:hypothetical protein